MYRKWINIFGIFIPLKGHTTVKNKLIIAICIDADEFQKHNVGWGKKALQKNANGMISPI